MKWILFALLLVGTQAVQALEERHEHSGTPHSEEDDAHEESEEQSVSSDVGPGKAVTAADPKQGIQLAVKAVEALGLQTRKVSALPVLVPKEGLVISREKTAVYRVREGWYKLVPLSDLRVGDEMVIQGSDLLRVADLAAFESGGGHSH